MTDKPEGERIIERLWKYCGAPKPEAAGAVVEEPVAEAATLIAEELIAETPLTIGQRTRIARWVAAQIVSYPPDRCLRCRRPIAFSAKWVELVNDNARARFHFDCAPVWRTQKEAAVRRAMGMMERSKC
jgi:hypothetical protein